jgi:hypothetical protein
MGSCTALAVLGSHLWLLGSAAVAVAGAAIDIREHLRARRT